MSALSRGEAWAEAYRARERQPEMGEAMGYAQEAFRAIEAVLVAFDSKRGLEALAGALAEFRARETERAKVEALAEAKAWYVGAISAAHRALTEAEGRAK